MEVSFVDNKPIHYDGSGNRIEDNNLEEILNDAFLVTDEMRQYISGTPYIFD